MANNPSRRPLRWLTFLWPVLLILLLFGLKTVMDKSRGGAGRVLYEKHCANCHMEQGEGLRGLYPPLAGADYVAAHEADMACLIRYGRREPLTVNGISYSQIMPGNPGLAPSELTALVNYIKTAWDENGETVSFGAVQAALDSCEGQEIVQP
ncbi:MAG: cytochrome c [Bacteroidetes bacterium]|nr:MAG: cytochrome c [Bacteroidota bacterium]